MEAGYLEQQHTHPIRCAIDVDDSVTGSAALWARTEVASDSEAARAVDEELGEVLVVSHPRHEQGGGDGVVWIDEPPGHEKRDEDEDGSCEAPRSSLSDCAVRAKVGHLRNCWLVEMPFTLWCVWKVASGDVWFVGAREW